MSRQIFFEFILAEQAHRFIAAQVLWRSRIRYAGSISRRQTESSPYGATTIAGARGELQPTKEDLAIAGVLGQRVPTRTKKLGGQDVFQFGHALSTRAIFKEAVTQFCENTLATPSKSRNRIRYRLKRAASLNENDIMFRSALPRTA